MNGNKEGSSALKLWAAAAVLRLAWAAWSGHLFNARDGLYDDYSYIDMALSFLNLSPRTWITIPPGFPLFLTPFIALGDAGLVLARLAQIALGAALAPLVYRLAKELGLSLEAALIAGSLAALHPLLVFFSARLMTETLFTFLVVYFFRVWLRAWKSGEPRLAAAAGLLGGLASLTRGVILPFGAVLALTACLRRREQPRWTLLVALCGTCWALAVAPWTARNWLRFDRFITISAQGGWNLYEGLTLDFAEIHHGRPEAMGREVEALGLRDPFEINAHFSRKAKAWIAEQPGAFLGLVARKALKFWRPFPYPPHSRAVRLGTGIFELLLLALAALGLASGAWRLPGLPFLLAWGLHLTALHSIFASNLRYRLPLEPFLAVLAGAGAAALLVRAKTGRIQP